MNINSPLTPLPQPTPLKIVSDFSNKNTYTKKKIENHELKENKTLSYASIVKSEDARIIDHTLYLSPQIQNSPPQELRGTIKELNEKGEITHFCLDDDTNENNNSKRSMIFTIETINTFLEKGRIQTLYKYIKNPFVFVNNLNTLTISPLLAIKVPCFNNSLEVDYEVNNQYNQPLHNEKSITSRTPEKKDAEDIVLWTLLNDYADDFSKIPFNENNAHKLATYACCYDIKELRVACDDYFSKYIENNSLESANWKNDLEKITYVINVLRDVLFDFPKTNKEISNLIHKYLTDNINNFETTLKKFLYILNPEENAYRLNAIYMLNFNNLPMTDELLELVSIEQPFLTHLSLKGCDNLTDKSGPIFGKFKNLTHLDLQTYGDLTETIYPSLASLSELQELNLSYCTIQNFNDKPLIWENLLISISALDKLQVLNLDGNWEIGDSCGESIARLKSLRSLSLKACNNITNDIGNFLKLLPNLEKLDLSSCRKLSNQIGVHLGNSKQPLQNISFLDCPNVNANIKKYFHLQHNSANGLIIIIPLKDNRINA